MVSIPDLKFAGSPVGLGVVGREGIGVVERDIETLPLSFDSFSRAGRTIIRCGGAGTTGNTSVSTHF